MKTFDELLAQIGSSVTLSGVHRAYHDAIDAAIGRYFGDLEAFGHFSAEDENEITATYAAAKEMAYDAWHRRVARGGFVAGPEDIEVPAVEEAAVAYGGPPARYRSAAPGRFDLPAARGRAIGVAPKCSRPQLTAPEHVAALFGPRLAIMEVEQLWVALLDAKSRVIREELIAQGSAVHAQVRIADLFREAVRHAAVALVCCHNHPSGDPTPSAADVALTRDIVAAGKLLDIDVIDHVILGEVEYVSLRRLGLGW